MFAVSWLELTNVVELTVTPPGFVVPVTNHCAFAPFLNPLPLTVMSRLMVPWAAALGLVELTWIWPTAQATPKTTKAATNVSRRTFGEEDEMAFMLDPPEQFWAFLLYASLSLYTDTN